MADGNWEDYVYPGTNVLRNKADIQNQAELQRFERGATAIRAQELREHPVRGDFDLAHLQDIHRHVFKDVYEWAGELRTVDMVKGNGANRTLFAFTEEIPSYGEKAHQLVKDAHYGRGLDKQEFAKAMTDVYAVVNEMHPFREGNGRATREYMNELASHSGHKLDYEKVGKEVWNEAAKESAHGNPAPMREVFYEITTVERAVAFDKLKPAEALAKHPELDGAYKAMMNARESGLDVPQLRAEISRDLHAGKVVITFAWGSSQLSSSAPGNRNSSLFFRLPRAILAMISSISALLITFFCFDFGRIFCAAPASSITSMALSGRWRSLMYLADSSAAACRAPRAYLTEWCSSKRLLRPFRISTVCSTDGSATSTFWKRRLSAASFSKMPRYSVKVVAPMHFIAPELSAGFSVSKPSRSMRSARTAATERSSLVASSFSRVSRRMKPTTRRIASTASSATAFTTARRTRAPRNISDRASSRSPAPC